MTCVRFLLPAIFSALLLVPAHAQAADWANLTGRFVVEGKVAPPGQIRQNVLPGINLVDESLVVDKNNGLQNVLVYVLTKNLPVAHSYDAAANREIRLDIRNGRFDPHLVILRTSQTLKLTNADPFNCNQTLSPAKGRAWNVLLPAAGTANILLATEDVMPVPVKDSIVPWLSAFVLVRSSPYAAISGPDGGFTIPDLPVATEFELQLWHERAGRLANLPVEDRSTDGKGRLKVTIQQGGHDLGDIKIPAALLERRR